MEGIDISNLNGNVNMSLVKKDGKSFIVAKATEGTTFVDSYYKQNITNAKDVGLIAGAYHFARFTDVSTAIKEANFFVNNCSSVKPDFVALDFEQQCSGDMTEACLAFLDIISNIAVAVIYCNPSYINSYLNAAITKYPLWIANYGVSSPSTPLWGSYVIWQYSESDQVPGISGNVDLDVMTDAFYNKLIGGNIVENIVCFNNGVDERAAEYLADYLKCSTIDNNRPYDYSNIKNVYCVGAGSFTSYCTKLIKGADRYATCQAVLDFIANGGK
ncbi:glycoside hydrolase family 25 protein [Clostridium thailandense]|uniref:glycoside hydrolase family 25 protein n=1 Tax=Clostridium thailandense TaxID=2794346 RepID=UPI003988B5E2